MYAATSSPGPSSSAGRFFPPPFRLDRHPPESQQSSPSYGAPARKKRRLCFSSELPGPPKPHNEDGSENIEWARYQSTLKLKSKWDSIYERFKDAHLEEQDEIYLGRPGVKGDEPRFIKDRGILRGLKKRMKFGCFIKEEDLELKAEVEESEPLAVDASDSYGPVDTDEDEIGGWGEKSFLLAQYPEFQREDENEPGGTGSGEGDVDADLQEFLAAEARRKELCPEEEDSEDEIVDFGANSWRRSNSPSLARATSSERIHSPLCYSSSDDEIDIIDLTEDPEEELARLLSIKRENVDRALAGNGRLPYDIPGLEDLIKTESDVQEGAARRSSQHSARALLNPSSSSGPSRIGSKPMSSSTANKNPSSLPSPPVSSRGNHAKSKRPRGRPRKDAKLEPSSDLPESICQTSQRAAEKARAKHLVAPIPYVLASPPPSPRTVPTRASSPRPRRSASSSRQGGSFQRQGFELSIDNIAVASSSPLHAAPHSTAANAVDPSSSESEIDFGLLLVRDDLRDKHTIGVSGSTPRTRLAEHPKRLAAIATSACPLRVEASPSASPKSEPDAPDPEAGSMTLGLGSCSLGHAISAVGGQ